MMGRQGIVDGVRKNAEAIVKDEEEKEEDESEDTKLDAGTDLESLNQYREFCWV